MRKIKYRYWDDLNNNMVYGLERSGHFGFYLKNYECMQYIGEKDANGKEIYEGDIIKHISGTIAEVYWDETPLSFMFRNPKTKGIIMIYINELKDCEVIGNIYENSELLDKDNQSDD